MRAVPYAEPAGWLVVRNSRSIGPRTANLFSDLLLHDMGQRLADGVSQGNAGGSEFRTAPLWDSGSACSSCTMAAPATWTRQFKSMVARDSEARGTVSLYQQLSESDKQHLLNFLRSL